MSAARWTRIGLLGALLAAACTDTTTAPLTDEVVGEWKLASVNGVALPYAKTITEGRRLEIHQDKFVLHRDGTLTGTGLYLLRYPSGAVDTSYMEAYGTWARTDGQIIFMPSGVAVSDVSTLDVGVMKLQRDGEAYVYRR